MDLFRLDGKVALVTGSSAGIGYALAKALASAGAAVILNGRNSETVHTAAQSLRAEGLVSHEMPFDVTDRAAVDRAVEQIEANIGPIQILVNNGGMQRLGPLEEFATR